MIILWTWLTMIPRLLKIDRAVTNDALYRICKIHSLLDVNCFHVNVLLDSDGKDMMGCKSYLILIINQSNQSSLSMARNLIWKLRACSISICTHHIALTRNRKKMAIVSHSVWPNIICTKLCGDWSNGRIIKCLNIYSRMKVAKSCGLA